MNYRSVSVSAGVVMLAMCTVLMVSAQPASAQVVFDAATGGNATFDHTIGGGSDRVLVVGVAREGGGDVSVTYNGVDMTRIAAAEVRVDTGAGQWTDLFWLGEASLPAAGAHEVAITGDAGAGDIAAGAVSIENASQDGPEATGANGDFDSEGLLALDADITTLSDGAMTIDIIGSGFGEDDGAQDSTPTVQTVRAPEQHAASNYMVMSTYSVPTAGLTTVGYTITGDGANRVALSVAAFGSAGPNLSLSVEGSTYAEEGGNITLTGNDTMAAPFQWQKDGGDIGGETTNTLALVGTVEADTGVYTLTFDDGAKAIISSNPIGIAIFPAGSLPVAGIIGLGALAMLCAAGGTVAMRRRK